MNTNAQWDHIVIGAGSAGAIVAARLSEEPDCKVLLIEAGERANKHWFRIPSMSASKVVGNPKYDWLFTTEPDPSRLDRVDTWSRGKVMGGSSQLNGTIYVRGNRADYDHWEELGNSGWGYDSLIPFFRKLENGKAVSDEYGQDGPVHITRASGAPEICNAFMNAMDELGVPITMNYNGEVQTGVAKTHFNQNRGLRESTDHSYLKEARKRKNLTIITNTLARRIIFKGKRAVGVEFDCDGKTRVEYCRYDVVLSASAINSPKLLMLSGIGDPDELKKHGIKTIHANPGVGKQLQEHPLVQIKCYVNVRTMNQDMGILGQIKIGIRWLLTRGGPASFLYPAVAFAKTSKSLEHPDLQFHFLPWINDMGAAHGAQWLDRSGVTMLVNVNRSASRGFVELRSSDPYDPPKIQPNMLADRNDLELLKKGVKLGRQVWRTKAFAPYFEEEYMPSNEVDDDEELENFIRRETVRSYHACGTSRMGVDDTAVVDPRLKVHGVENLRVIDCSIIPQVPSGNINAISMLIGEKGAAMIKEDKHAN